MNEATPSPGFPISLDRDEAFMALALQEAEKAYAEDEVPIGAIVVFEPLDRETRRPVAEARVIAQGHNERERRNDPAAHAEFIALEAAARTLNAWRLSDCTLYVTLEPCLMCAGLMQQARIRRCVFGAFDPKAGALGSLYAVHEDKRLNHCFEVRSGVLEEESANLLRAFFAEKRMR